MVALAMRLALVDLMREQRPERGSICDLVILDESFGNVDSPRAKRFLELLLKDEEWQVLEIGSASRVEHPDSTTACTVFVKMARQRWTGRAPVPDTTPAFPPFDPVFPGYLTRYNRLSLNGRKRGSCSPVRL